MKSSQVTSVVPNGQSEPMAIVGMGCRFPGDCNEVESFWKMLTDGRSGIRGVPADRWNVERFYHPAGTVPGTMISKWGGFVGNLDQFDAGFWGISPREAMRMDPQQRWLLEVSWEALEDAGVAPHTLRGKPVGVFVGVAGNDYAGLQMPNVPRSDVHTISGCTLSICANRISYMLDLQGPSLSIDTACSSSLVALWSACQSIRSGDCSSAIVCGVNAIITPEATIGFSKASMLSRSGQCFAFDQRANGYVRGEGAGAIYIKPLSRAVADGDRIYALIRAAVSNQDGHTSSMTVPSSDGQSALLRKAYDEAGILPARVVYMEAHGTGTPVGDPIEASALGSVLRDNRPVGKPCLMGSVKTNLGHLEAGSGIAGAIKAALILHHDLIPPSLNFETPNPHIPFAELGLQVVTELQPLPHANGAAPVVGVNSFGFGGANAHVVLEQAPSRQQIQNEAIDFDRPYLLPISARSDTALRSYFKAYRDLLANSADELPAICYSAGSHKEHHAQRIAVIGKDAVQIRRRLGAWLRSETVEGLVEGEASTIANEVIFVFTGQGSQWYAMGRKLLEREPIFKQTIVEIDALLRPYVSWSLTEELTRDESESRINQTDIAQPSLFALQVGLSALWQSWGILPSKVIGHSVGEVAAAYAAGIYTLAEAVKVIFERSRLQHTTGGHGRMLAVGLSADEACEAIGDAGDRVAVAVFNSPRLVTLSGDSEPLEEIAGRLEREGKFVRWLPIDYAFHTHQMDPIKEELLQTLANIHGRESQIPFISTVTGMTMRGENLDAMYWWNNVRQPVKFAPALANLIRENDNLTFLEIGPHPALSSSIQECLSERSRQGRVFHSLRRGADDSQELLTNLAGLHVCGLPIEWETVNRCSRRFHRLPHYPWCRETFWLESSQSQRSRLAPIEHPLLGMRLATAKPTWQVELDLRRFAYLADHRFWDSSVFPATGYAEMGLAVARQIFPGEAYVVENLEITKVLFLNDDQPTTVQIVFDPQTRSIGIHSKRSNEEEWDFHAQGRLTLMPHKSPEPFDSTLVKQRLTEHLSHDQHFQGLAETGYQFGPQFKQLQNVWRLPSEALAEIEVPANFGDAAKGYYQHPAILDACLHVSFHLKGGMTKDDFFLPKSIGRISLIRDCLGGSLWAHGLLKATDDDSVTADIFIYDNENQIVAEISGLLLERVEKRQADRIADDCLYQLHWVPHRLRSRDIEGDCQFPAAADIVGAARAIVPEQYRQQDGQTYYELIAPQLDALANQEVYNAWRELGWRPFIGERFTATELFDRLGVVPEQQRLAMSQLYHFGKQGWLLGVGDDAWEVARVFEPTDTSGQWDAITAQYPKCAPEVALHKMVSPHLGDVLAGERDPLEVLFPGGSQEHLERFYLDGADFPSAMNLVRAAIARMLETLPAGRMLRVLEIGGGTGGLTRALLPLFPKDRTEYLFTDIGSVFLTAAKKQFADYPFVDYRRFDIERAPQGQGLEANGYDLILGTLVLHATVDIKETLLNLRSCLASGGMLLFNELFPHRNAWDNIFGLLKGWWRFTDTERRQHSPLLERESWLALLSECGYHDPGSFGTSINESESAFAFLFAFAPSENEEVMADRELATMGHYAVFADTHGVGNGISTRLRERGNQVVEILAGSEFRQVSPFVFQVAVDSQADFCRALEQFECPTEKLSGVVHCWSLDRPGADGISVEELSATQQTSVLSVLELIHAISSGVPQRMFFVTRDACLVQEGDRLDGIATSPLIGTLRVANNELFPNKSVLIDIDADDSVAIENVFYEITGGDGELEIAYRNSCRYVSRLTRVGLEHLPFRTRDSRRPTNALDRASDVEARIPFRLQTSKPGILTNLTLNETHRCELKVGEIEVRVRAAGINFRDLMKALGTHPGNPADLLWFGDDVAGTVVRVGPGVSEFRPGDSVAGLVPYGFSAFVTIDSRMVYRMPSSLTFEEAATVPTVFMTAHHALINLARMTAGESILIHAGAGGVGQAAIQIAKHLGLVIFATAGTPEKRELLSEMGVPYVLNSRTLAFADEIMRLTGGRGVDAVLNSLAGDFIPKSISVLAPFGRFLEIGKVDIYKNTTIGLQPFKNNISYFAIDLVQQIQQTPNVAAHLLREVSERVAGGDYQPLSRTVFPITEVVEAFRYMAQGKHVGKIVLNFDVEPIPIGLCTDDVHRFRSDATYLITGGAGGIGLELAKWIGRHGARHLVLLSRSGPQIESARQDIEQLRSEGVQVWDARGDVTCAEDVQKVVNQISAEMPPLRGVIHAAMVLDDEFLVSLDAARFITAMKPKMVGAWNLHIATVDLPLDHFICMSSMSNIVGFPKQGNYNAGNNFLDSLCAFRNARGLPALTINWGPIVGAGFVERNRKTAEFLPKVGSRGLSLDEVITIFSRLMLLDPIQIGVAHLDWSVAMKVYPNLGVSNTYAAVARKTAETDQSGSLLLRVQRADADARAMLVEDFVAAQVAAVFGVVSEKIDRGAMLTSVGLDSLMALELANRLQREVTTSIPMKTLLGEANVIAVAQTLLRMLLDAGPNSSDTSGKPTIQSDAPLPSSDDPYFHVLISSEAERSLAELHFDGVALVYLPDKFSSVAGLTDQQLQTMFGTKPFVSHYYELDLGRIGIMMLPFRSQTLLRQDEVRQPILDAIELASQHGARCVSLTGLIPSMTNYGHDIADWLASSRSTKTVDRSAIHRFDRGAISDYPGLTTGHATTTAAVVRNLEQMLSRVGRSLDQETLAVLGLGSIGQSCLKLLLEVCPHPREIILCDVFAMEHSWHAFAASLRDEHGYQGPIRLASSDKTLPPEVYGASTILTAVSAPDVLDVQRLRPGTVIVDDSYPPAFSVEDAMRRLHEDADIVFSNAGNLRLPNPICETMVVPKAAEELLKIFGVATYRQEVIRDPHELTACVLSSLLTGLPDGNFPATLGLATLPDLVAHYHSLNNLHFESARPQCDKYFLPEVAVERFRQNFCGVRTPVGELP